MRRIAAATFTLFLLLAGVCNAAQAPARIIPVPEYENDLSRVLLSLPAREDHLVFQEDLISSLPPYSKIFVLVADGNLYPLEDNIAGKPYADRVELVPYDVTSREQARYYMMVAQRPTHIGVHQDKPWPQGTIWARDSYVMARKANGKPQLLVPVYYRHLAQPLVDPGQKPRIVFDNDYLLSLREYGAHMTKRMPLAFDGGNVMFDRLNEKTIAFLGLDALTASEAIGQAFGAPMDRNGLLKAFRNFFNVDEIHVAGTGMRQPEVMFHLDQAMTLLPGHRAAILTPEGPLPESETDQRKLAEVTDFLKQLRTLLADLGYETVDLKTSVSAILGYRFPNLAAYTDRDTGTPTVLFSAYADDSAQDKAFRKENRERLHALGFVTREVSTSASQNNGGIHCLYNTM